MNRAKKIPDFLYEYDEYLNSVSTCLARVERVQKSLDLKCKEFSNGGTCRSDQTKPITEKHSIEAQWEFLSHQKDHSIESIVANAHNEISALKKRQTMHTNHVTDWANLSKTQQMKSDAIRSQIASDSILLENACLAWKNADTAYANHLDHFLAERYNDWVLDKKSPIYKDHSKKSPWWTLLIQVVTLKPAIKTYRAYAIQFKQITGLNLRDACSSHPERKELLNTTYGKYEVLARNQRKLLKDLEVSERTFFLSEEQLHRRDTKAMPELDFDSKCLTLKEQTIKKCFDYSKTNNISFVGSMPIEIPIELNKKSTENIKILELWVAMLKSHTEKCKEFMHTLYESSATLLDAYRKLGDVTVLLDTIPIEKTVRQIDSISSQLVIKSEAAQTILSQQNSFSDIGHCNFDLSVDMIESFEFAPNHFTCFDFKLAYVPLNIDITS